MPELLQIGSVEHGPGKFFPPLDFAYYLVVQSVNDIPDRYLTVELIILLDQSETQYPDCFTMTVYESWPYAFNSWLVYDCGNNWSAHTVFRDIQYTTCALASSIPSVGTVWQQIPRATVLLQMKVNQAQRLELAVPWPPQRKPTSPQTLHRHQKPGLPVPWPAR